MPRQIVHQGDMYRINPENPAWIDKNPNADGRGWIKIYTGDIGSFPHAFEDLIDGGDKVFASTVDAQGNRHQVVSNCKCVGWIRQWI